eukprot:28224-Chlamydomonas_euryale.AAC.19
MGVAVLSIPSACKYPPSTLFSFCAPDRTACSPPRRPSGDDRKLAHRWVAKKNLCSRHTRRHGRARTS